MQEALRLFAALEPATTDWILSVGLERTIARNDAIAVSLLIQTIQIIPMTALGVALAPEFIFRRGGKKAEQDPVLAEVREVSGKLHEGKPPEIPVEEASAISQRSP